MPESFGARLRQQREARQIDLIAIAEQTKIKLSLLEALERGDVSHWPSGIFRRAYIRAYAQFIGLDPDTVLREFLEVHPDPGDAFVATVAGAAAAEEEYAKTAGSLRFRNIVDTALGSLTRLRRPVLAGKRPPSEAPTVPAVIEIPAARQADTRVWMQVEESAAEPCRDDMVQQPAEVPVALETPQASIAPSASEPVEPLPRDSAPLLDSPSPVLERREEAPPLTMQTTPTVTSTDSEAAREARLEAVAHLC